MKMVKRAAFIVAMALALTALAPSTVRATDSEQDWVSGKKCTIANSNYITWTLLWAMKENGTLKKWGDKYNTQLDVSPVMGYPETIAQFQGKQFCGVSVANVDVLIGPASGGVDTTYFVFQDYSNDNDGAVIKSAKPVKLADLCGKDVRLVESTVSHFLLWRALQHINDPKCKVTTNNANDEVEVGSAYTKGGEGAAAVTWNPVLMQIRQEVKGTQQVFGSSTIPGEIIDGIAVQSNAHENIKKAITGAWYEAVAVLGQRGSPAYTKTIELMAKYAGGTPKEVEQQLSMTKLFDTAAVATAFAKDSQLKGTMDKVRTFTHEIGIYPKGKSADYVGIQLPDKSMLGDKGNVKLRFDTTFMEQAAAGKL